MISSALASCRVTPFHGRTAPTRSSVAVPPDPNGTRPFSERSEAESFSIRTRDRVNMVLGGDFGRGQQGQLGEATFGRPAPVKTGFGGDFWPV
jgi:hypothetical protein